MVIWDPLILTVLVEAVGLVLSLILDWVGQVILLVSSSKTLSTASIFSEGILYVLKEKHVKKTSKRILGHIKIGIIKFFFTVMASLQVILNSIKSYMFIKLLLCVC